MYSILLLKKTSLAFSKGFATLPSESLTLPIVYHHLSQLHPVQSGILRTLLFKPEASFTDLNVLHVPSDQFSFHIRRLVEEGILAKEEAGYRLTTAGKQLAQLMDPETGNYERQGKIGVAISSVRVEGGHTQYLIQERLKQPYFGFHGLMTGKIRWGETVPEAAARVFEEETGLSAEFDIVAIKHKMDYDAAGELLEDKFFFVLRADNLSGPFKQEFEGGRNRWMTKAELDATEKVFEGVEDSLHWLQTPQLTYKEVKYRVEGY